jgi:uncharacterized protein YggU (UPF0235/DUF167 family)
MEKAAEEIIQFFSQELGKNKCYVELVSASVRASRR